MREIFADFFGKSPSMLKDIEQKSTRVYFAPDETILSEETKGNTVFFILKGSAKVVLHAKNGEEVWLDEFGSGTLFGEMAVLIAQPRSADIVASSHVELAAFTAKNFLKLMEKHGSIGLAVSKMLANRVHKTTRRLYELRAFSVKGRVYAELLRLAEQSKHQDIISTLPHYTEIAKNINSSRETVSRTISELIKNGIVEKTETELVILDIEALKDETGFPSAF